MEGEHIWLMYMDMEGEWFHANQTIVAHTTCNVKDLLGSKVIVSQHYCCITEPSMQSPCAIEPLRHKQLV